MIERIKNIFNGNLYALSLYARQIAGTLVLFVIARYLSVYDYGLFSSYKTITGFCLMFANLGFADYILVSSKANSKEVKLKISLFLLFAILIVFITALGSLPFKLNSHLLFILIAIRTFFDLTFFGLILPYFQSTKTFNTIAKINIFYATGISIIALLSYFLKLSLLKFLILSIILGVINFIQCSYFSKINYFLALKHLKRFFLKLDKTVFNYAFVTIIAVFYVQIQGIYVSIFMSKEDAALFFSAFTVASVLSLFVEAHRQKLIPELTKTQDEDAKAILKSHLYNIYLFFALAFIMLIFFGKNILTLVYGQEYYQKAYWILLTLAFSNLFQAILVTVGTYLTAKNKVHKKLPMQTEAVFVAIITLIVFKDTGLFAPVSSYMATLVYLALRYIMTVNKEIGKYERRSKMIKILQPKVISSDDSHSRLSCDILVDNKVRNLWFEVEKEYEPYLCYERSDAFVIGLLSWAMRLNHDIECTAPVSEELLYNLRTYLIPSLAKHGKDLHNIKILTPPPHTLLN